MKTCNKQKYDKKTAKTILNERKLKGKKWSREIRYYECPHPECKGAFHLTSKKEYYEIEPIPIGELLYKEKWLKLI